MDERFEVSSCMHSVYHAMPWREITVVVASNIQGKLIWVLAGTGGNNMLDMSWECETPVWQTFMEIVC